MVDRGGNLGRSCRAVLGRACDVVALSHHASALDASAGHDDGPTRRPVVAPPDWVDLGRAAELAHGQHHGVIEQARLRKVFDQRGEGVVEHRTDLVAVALDGAERARAVDIPGGLAEHRIEHVDGHEPHPGLDQALGEQAAVERILAGIAACRQRQRPNRSFPRLSRKPASKWRSSKATATATTA